MGEFINSGWQLLQAEKALKRLPFNPELPLKCTSREFNIAAKHVMESALVLQPYIPDIVIGLDFPIKELKDVESPEAEFLYKLGYNVPWTIQSSAWWKELTPTDRMISQLFRRFIKSR